MIAAAYHWPPSVIYSFDLEDFKSWTKAAENVLKGKY